jgi:hypothetical protein
LAKQTSTSEAIRVRIKLSAPFMLSSLSKKKISHPMQAAEKVIFSRLLKKGQMQGPRNPEK